MCRIFFRVAKATSLHQHQWANKWTLLTRRPFTKSHYYFNSNGTNSKQSQTGKQGKLHRIRRKWRWGAGAAGWTVLSFLDWWLLIVGGYLSWQSVFLRWTPLGVVLVAAAQWHLHHREQTRQGLPLTAPHWQVTLNLFQNTTLRVSQLDAHLQNFNKKFFYEFRRHFTAPCR